MIKIDESHGWYLWAARIQTGQWRNGSLTVGRLVKGTPITLVSNKRNSPLIVQTRPNEAKDASMNEIQEPCSALSFDLISWDRYPVLLGNAQDSFGVPCPELCCAWLRLAVTASGDNR